MQTTWVVAADSSRVRIFEVSSSDHEFHEIEDLANPQGRSETRELSRDSYGRFYGKGERQQGHTAPPHVDPSAHEIEQFSKDLGAYLEKARNDHRYDKLCLIAPPKFLGLLRQNLSDAARKLVDEEMAKDMSWQDAADIEHYLTSSRH